MSGSAPRPLDPEPTDPGGGEPLDQLKSRFVALVSHEFRTPLGIITSAVELLRHYEHQLPAPQKLELLDDIHAAARLLSSLMERMLVLGRVESGRVLCRPVAIDLAASLDLILSECSTAAGQRCPVSLHLEGPLGNARADEALLRHILGNLVSNAIKYSPAGSPVQVRVSRQKTHALFEVQDHGIGIPEPDQTRLFEAFFRGGNVGDTPGTGLGLVIVKRSVELHGGTLALDSEPGRGSTFRVRLPLFAKPQSGAAAEAPA